MKKKFDYVVAHPWNTKEDSNLAIYTFGSEVQQGQSKKDARNFLAYVKRMSPNKDWAVYKVKFTKIE